MKKILAVLLALCVVGGFAFAQAKVAVGIDGKTTLINQDYAGFTGYYNNTYVSGLTFSGASEDGVKGLSIAAGGAFYTANPLVITSYKGYWNFFDKALKLSVGYFSMGDYRQTTLYTGSSAGYLGGGKKQQLLAQVYPVAGLSIGVQLPYSTTSAWFENIAKSAALGVSYAIADVGTVKAFTNLNALTPFIGGSFLYNGNDMINAALIATFDTSDNSVWANVSATYTKDALWAALEADFAYGTALSYTIYAEVDYTLTDAITLWVGGSYGDAAGTASYDAFLTCVYDFGNGVQVKPTVGYNSALYWNLPVYFSVNF